jgi:hypothetical protein
MAGIQREALDQPDQTRPVEKGKVEVVELDAGTVMRTTFEPGWRWSECVKPVVGGDSCQVDHFGYCISGQMHVRMNDGDEMDTGPGDATDPARPRRLDRSAMSPMWASTSRAAASTQRPSSRRTEGSHAGWRRQSPPFTSTSVRATSMSADASAGAGHRAHSSDVLQSDTPLQPRASPSWPWLICRACASGHLRRPSVDTRLATAGRSLSESS